MAEHYHLAGVAGVGMSALAQALLARGYEVSGSDRFRDQGCALPVLSALERLGVRLLPQDGSGLRSSTRALVVSTAIESDNPDLLAAQRLGVPVVHRAELLALLTKGRRLIAVTGTSGKTTVTGLIGWLLERAGWDPTVINGGAVLNWREETRPGNFRAGRGDWWVIEADESDGSCLRFEPEWAVITNLSRDHFDIQETIELFRAFAARARAGVICGRGLAKVLADAHPECIEESFPEGPEGFECGGLSFRVPLPGEHNRENARLAVAVGFRLGLDAEGMRAALASFRGIERRLETVGRVGGITVVDDYAHNPAKIVAAWRAVRATHNRVLGIWRPHGFAPLAAMFNDLVAAFASVLRSGDRLYVLPVFYAGGTARKSVDSADLVESVRLSGVCVELAAGYDEVEGHIVREAREGDAILVMGARDPRLPVFARRIVSALESRGAR